MLGSSQWRRFSGTLSVGCSLFLASLQASKLASAHLVFLLVFAGVIPFESRASSLLSTNLEKRLFVLELLLLLSGGRSSLLWLVQVLVPFEVEGGRSCTEAEVVSSGQDSESATPGQPVHEHSPRQKGSTGQAWHSSNIAALILLRV